MLADGHISHKKDRDNSKLVRSNEDLCIVSRVLVKLHHNSNHQHPHEALKFLS